MRFSLRNRRGCRKGEAGGESLQEDSHHYRFYGRGGQRPHERDDTGKLQSHQSRRAANRRRRTGTHQERSGAGAPVTTDVMYKRILAANSARILLYSVIH